MDAFFQAVSRVFEIIVEYGILALEFVGVVIILWTAARCIVLLVMHKGDIRLRLAQGIALALEFKLGSEVLRTTIVRNVEELLIAGAIVALRALMTFLIHWEIKNEEARLH